MVVVISKLSEFDEGKVTENWSNAKKEPSGENATAQTSEKKRSVLLLFEIGGKPER
jgi:hypothetical protein